MDELSSVKSIIRSMLISEPSQRMTLREIARRHREDEGKPIPYVKLGFNSLEQFLRSIPDTAQFSGFGDGAVLRPVINKEVSHIQSMILRQKPPKSKGRNHSRSHNAWSQTSQPRQQSSSSNYNENAGGFRQLHSVPSDTRYSSSWGQSHHRNSHGTDTSPQQSTNAKKKEVYSPAGGFRQPHLVPSDTRCSSSWGQSHHGNSGSDDTSPPQPAISKKEEFYLPPSLNQKLLQIVCADPGLSIQKFESSVKKDHPFLTGIFPNINDLINVMGTMYISDGCVHIIEEKDTCHSKQAVEKTLYPGVASLQPVIPAGMESDSDYEMHDVMSSHSTPRELPLRKPPAEYNASESIQSTSAVDAALHRLRPPAENLHTGRNVERCFNDDLKQMLVKLLLHYSTGIWCSMLSDIFQKYYRINLDCRDSGFTSIIEMLKSCPETFVCVQEKGSWKVCNAKVGNPTESAGCVPNHLKEKIKRLIVKYPNGIHIDAFADLYERLYQTEFNWNDMRFGSIDDLFLSINNTVIKMKTESSRFVILPLEVTKDHTFENPVAVSNNLALNANPGIHDLIPINCVHPSYEFPKLVMPKGVIPGSSLCLIIAAVSNLDNFYVHIRGKGYSESLDDLTDRMMLFYESNHQNYRIPPEAVVPGIICVTLTFGDYSRCVISAEKDSKTVTVLPVDYGCTMSVKKSELLFLHKDFAQFPPQAINCRCANLTPQFNETTFKRHAATRFLELVKDKAIFARIAQYDQQRNFLSVSLTDTSGEEDVHINDVLCQEGLAAYKMEAPITVKAPTIKSPLRLLDRLKQEKDIAGDEIVADNHCSVFELPTTNLAMKSTCNMVSTPVNSSVNGVADSKSPSWGKLAALHADGNTPITLNSLGSPFLSSHLSVSRPAGRARAREHPEPYNGVLQGISPQKPAERIVR